MSIMLRLFADLLKMLVFFTLRLTETLIGLAARLFYWSVRRYGWGRVLGFFAAGMTGLWLYRHWAPSPWGEEALLGIGLLTLILFGASLLLVGAIARFLQFRQYPRLPSIRRPGTSSRSMKGTKAELVIAPFPAVTDNEAQASPEASTLWERCVSLATLQQAWQRVLVRAGGPGSDGMTVEAFALVADTQINTLAEELSAGRYRPQPSRWVEIAKSAGGMRRVAVLCVRDRVVQLAVHIGVSGLWDQRFAPCSYAYRPGRSALQAVAAVEEGLAQGRVWLVDADIATFFDDVSHHRLFAILDDWLPDQRLRWLIKVGVSATSFENGKGLAQGSPLSPLLANIYLHGFDVALLRAGYRLVRYSDDFVLLCATQLQAEEALRTATGLLRQLGLRIKPERTRIVHRDQEFTFLGYTFTATGKRPSEQAVVSMQRRLQGVQAEDARQRIITGWRSYFGAESFTFATGSTPGDVVAEDDSWWLDVDTADDYASVSEPRLPPSVPTAVPSTDWSEYRRRFVGRSDVYACYWRTNGRRGYRPVRQMLSDADLEAHLRGEVVLGTYLLHSEGSTKALVFDVDGRTAADANTVSEAKEAFALTRRLVSALRGEGVQPVWFDSGGKGFHLWLCFSVPVSAGTVKRWAEGWLDRFRPFPEGVTVEVFPKQEQLAAGALGSLIRLPLGLHPETGRRAHLLSDQGEVVPQLWPWLQAAALVDPRTLSVSSSSTKLDSTALQTLPKEVAAIVEGCTLIQGVLRNARQKHHLRHVERLALLYVLGTCGEAGQVFLHQVVGLCANYDPKITERWIHRLQEGHKPIRCATLREWLKDHLPGVACGCADAGQRRSPLARRPKSAGAQKATALLTEEDWTRIAGDLFDPEDND